MKHGKKYIESAKSFDNQKLYDPEEGISVVLSTAKAKFDETIEAHIRLGVDSRHADQQVRGAVVLPHGTGKVVRVLVFAKGDKHRKRARISSAMKIWSKRFRPKTGSVLMSALQLPI